MINSLLFILLDAWTDIQSTANYINAAIVNLCYVFCALFGLIGSLRIYNKWQLHGKHHLHLDAEIAGWFGASLFFLAAQTFIEIVL